MSTSKHCSKYCSNEWGVPDTSREVLKIGHLQGLLLLLCDDLAQKEMLPQSTERIVEVQGTPEGTKGAIWEICKCLVDDWQRGTGIVLYNPVIRIQFETTHIHSVGQGDSKKRVKITHGEAAAKGANESLFEFVFEDMFQWEFVLGWCR
ncbi:KH domain-containing protein [Colletotrichum acutatum]